VRPERSVALERRRALDAAVREELGAKASAHLIADASLADARCIAAYSPLRGELDVLPFAREVLARGQRLCLPRVVGPGQMVFVPVDDLARDVEQGAYGILEPRGESIDIAEITAFIVPGVWFDVRGGRVGMGMGYYDRALAGAERAVRVGAGYAWQMLEDELEQAPHDMPMHRLVSPRGLVDAR